MWQGLHHYANEGNLESRSRSKNDLEIKKMPPRRRTAATILMEIKKQVHTQNSTPTTVVLRCRWEFKAHERRSRRRKKRRKKCTSADISCIVLSELVKLGWKVECGRNVKNMWLKMTLTLVQGHSKWSQWELEVGKLYLKWVIRTLFAVEPLDHF